MIKLSEVYKYETCVANLSGGKDSLAKVLGLMEKGYPLTHVVFFDTGMEFQAVYRNIERIKPLVEDYGAKLVILKAKRDFLSEMLIRRVEKRDGSIQYGYDWCGVCRWRTAQKVQCIDAYLRTLGNYVQYIGIAYDEPERITHEKNKCYPLFEWKMTERDCLQYCYSRGWNWVEDDNSPDLYQILKRVSCWCCKNKNLAELRNMYHYLPYYWELLKGLQSRIDRPFYGKYTIFELEKRFQLEDAWMWRSKAVKRL